jgi:hypothetical protein
LARLLTDPLIDDGKDMQVTVPLALEHSVTVDPLM